MSAMVIAQASAFAAMPVLSNLYSPDDFGELGLFILVVGFFVSFVTFRIEWSVPSASSKLHADYLIIIAIKTCLLLSTFISIFFFTPLGIWLLTTVGITSSSWAIVIGPAVFVGGLTSILQTDFIRRNSLNKVAISLVLQSLMNTIFSFLLVFFQFGLIFAQIISSSATAYYLGYGNRTSRDYRLILKSKLTTIRAYRRQIISSVSVSVLNFFFQNSFPIILALNFSTKEVGLFFLASKIANAPVTLVSTALANSFWGEISELVSKDLKKAKSFYLQVTTKLLLGSLPLLAGYYLLSIYIETIFPQKAWATLGEVIQMLLPLLFANFVFSSTNHLIVYDKQHYQLFTDLASIFATFLVVWMSRINEWEFLNVVFLMSMVTLCLYAVRFMLHLMANNARQLKK